MEVLAFACNGNAIVSRSRPSNVLSFCLLSRWVRWLSIFPAALSAAGDDIRAARVMRWEADTFWFDNSSLSPFQTSGPRGSHEPLWRWETERLKESTITKLVRAQKHDLQVLQMSGQGSVGPLQWGWSFDLPKSWQAMVSVMLKMILFCTQWYFSLYNSYDSFYHALQVSRHSCLHSKSVIFGLSFYWLLLLSISPLSVPACWPCWNSGFFNLFLGSREMERSLQPEVHANNANLRQNLQTDWNLWTLPSVAYNAPDLVVVVVDFGKSKDLPMMKRRIYTKMDANGKSDCVEPQNLLQQFSLDDLLRQRNALRFLLWIVRGLNKNELRMKAERWSWITHGWGLQRKSASMLEMRIAHVQDQKEVGALTCYQMFIISLQKLLNLQCLHWKLKFRIKNYPHFRPSQQPQQPCQSLSFAAFWRTVYRWKVWHAGSNRQILQGGHDMPSTLSSQTVGSLEVLAFKCKKYSGFQ